MIISKRSIVVGVCMHHTRFIPGENISQVGRLSDFITSTSIGICGGSMMALKGSGRHWVFLLSWWTWTFATTKTGGGAFGVIGTIGPADWHEWLATTVWWLLGRKGGILEAF